VNLKDVVKFIHQNKSISYSKKLSAGIILLFTCVKARVKKKAVIIQVTESNQINVKCAELHEQEKKEK
jgi:hypothetical protein